MSEVSPELALVDPELAARLRAALPEIVPSPHTRAHARPVAVPEPEPEQAPEPEAEPALEAESAVEAPESAAPVRERRRGAGWIVVPVVLAALGALAGLTVLAGALRERPLLERAEVAGTQLPETPTEPAPTTTRAETMPTEAAPPPTRTEAPPPPTTPALTPARVFAWADVRGATAYAVRVSRGSTVLLRKTVQTPRFEVPRGFRFRPGTYRWTVQPLRGAEPLGRPTVDSRFTVARTHG